MPFELKSNPLENNALFGNAAESETETAAEPKKKQRPKKKTTEQTVKKEIAKVSEPAPEKKTEPEAAPQPTVEDYTRATFIVRRDLLKQLKDYAYTERREIKDAINEILEKSLKQIRADYEKDGKEMLEAPAGSYRGK